MPLELGDVEDARRWLTDDNWLTFGFEGDFCEFLEYNYFEPGTEKNAEFETMMLPLEGRVSFWFRIKDTEKNRENLRKALSQFYEYVADDIEEEIEQVQKNVEKVASNIGTEGE